MSFQELAIKHRNLTLERARIDEEGKFLASENEFLAGLFSSEGALEELDRQLDMLEEQAYDALNDGSEGEVEDRVMFLTQAVTGNLRILQKARDLGYTSQQFTVNLITSDQRIRQVIERLQTEGEQTLAAELIADRLYAELFPDEMDEIAKPVETPIQPEPIATSGLVSLSRQEPHQGHSAHPNSLEEDDVIDRSSHSYVQGTILRVGEESFDLAEEREILAIAQYLLHSADKPLNPRELFEAIGTDYELSRWAQIRPILSRMFGPLLYDVKKRPLSRKNPRPEYVVLTPDQYEEIMAAQYDASRFGLVVSGRKQNTVSMESEIDKVTEEIFEGSLSIFAIGQLLTQVRNAATSLQGTEYEGFFVGYEWILDELVNPQIDRAMSQDRNRAKAVQMTDAQLMTMRSQVLNEVKRYIQMDQEEYDQETDELPEIAAYTVMYFKDQSELLNLAEVINNTTPGFYSESRVGRSGNVVERLNAFLMGTDGKEYSLPQLLRELKVDPVAITEARQRLENMQNIIETLEEVDIPDSVKVLTGLVDENVISEPGPDMWDAGTIIINPDRAGAIASAKANLRKKEPNLDNIVNAIVGRLADRNALGNLDTHYSPMQATTLVQSRQHVVNEWYARQRGDRKRLMPLRDIIIFAVGQRQEKLRALFEQISKKDGQLNQDAFLEIVKTRIEEVLKEQAKKTGNGQ